MTQHKERSDATSGQLDPKLSGLGRSSNKHFFNVHMHLNCLPFSETVKNAPFYRARIFRKYLQIRYCNFGENVLYYIPYIHTPYHRACLYA